MGRRQSTPDKRASEAKREVSRVRRKYKVNLDKNKKFMPGEEEHVATMVIVLKLAGYTNTQIGRTIGISRGQVKEFLSKPEVAERLAELREALPAAALQLLQGYLIEAVQAVVDVMRKSEEDTTILKAAAEIFDRAGLPKASRQEKDISSTSTTKITDDGLVDQLRESSPEVQEQAAQLIEQLENLLETEANTSHEEGVSDEQDQQ